MERAAYAIAGIGLGFLFFPAMNVTFTAMAVLRAAITGGW